MVSETSRAATESGDAPMEQLVKLSRRYGSDMDFVIAGGGNTSLKDEATLFVKPSGVSLATIEADDFVQMRRRSLDALVETDLGSDPQLREARFKESILAARLHPERGQRPSVECVLHSMLPRRYVVHTHSTAANCVGCSVDGQSLCRELFGDDVLWIPYVDPGYVLARSIRRALDDYAARTGQDCPGALLMQNHGLLVCGDTPQEIDAITDRIVRTIRERAGGVDQGLPFGAFERIDGGPAATLVNTLGPLLRGLLSDGNTLKIVSFDDAPEVLSYMGSTEGKAIVERGPFTPDQIVYCGSFPLWFEAAAGEDREVLASRLSDAVAEYRSRTGVPPLVVLVKGLGMFTAGQDYAGARNVRYCYRDAIRVAAGATRFGGAHPLAERDRRFIEDWEVEAYRKQVAARARKGRVSGRVALVTGAAQGFGREIALALTEEGAHVAFTDLNLEGARAAAEPVCRKHGQGRGTALQIDVTDPGAVGTVMHAMVREYGGLDLLISNAGVLLAGSVMSQSERDFDLVTRVNYRGYFLCVKHAAPIMALQRRARPGYWSDIIQINSKSGLVGSNRNSAYAGSKFGAIGLTQSFALELVEHGIKVNAICPGNFFEGPLWSDPETGLFVQYLRTGKVPGATTIDDVRCAYEAKVPMGRGCTGADVMKAIYYLVEQEYETGQALPVTGGQVMLS